jgi:DNA-binding NtrC family response regulator
VSGPWRSERLRITDDISPCSEEAQRKLAALSIPVRRLCMCRGLAEMASPLWPGNIRELQNVIERSVIVSSVDAFSVDESWLSKESSYTGISGASVPASWRRAE